MLFTDIDQMMFFGSRKPAGQVVFESLADGTARTVSWTVPEGVTAISAVAITARAGLRTSIARGAAYLLSTRAADTAYDVLNVGGMPGDPATISGANTSTGGGGAAGYAGSGGRGGNQNNVGAAAPAGGGGGGGGGGNTSVPGSGGGGTGLNGIGSSGAASGSVTGVGKAGSNGMDGKTPVSGTFPPPSGDGGNYGGGKGGQQGGELAYRNSIAVTPGEVLTLSLIGSFFPTGLGAIRIIWGDGRSFPSNAGDV